MTREEAARILDPKTMAEERMYYAYYRGFIGDRAWLTAVLEASHMGAKALRKLDEQDRMQVWDTYMKNEVPLSERESGRSRS